MPQIRGTALEGHHDLWEGYAMAHYSGGFRRMLSKERQRGLNVAVQRMCSKQRKLPAEQLEQSSPARLQTVLPRSMPKTLMSIRCSSLHLCPQ